LASSRHAADVHALPIPSRRTHSANARSPVPPPLHRSQHARATLLRPVLAQLELAIDAIDGDLEGDDAAFQLLAELFGQFVPLRAVRRVVHVDQRF
jgi:hypothetical protein